MQRFTPLLLVVLALAVPTVAFADGTTPPAPAGAAASAQHGRPFAKMRLEILRLRVQLVHLRYRVVCHDPSSSACTTFTQKAVDRLTTIDKNVQAKLAQLNCSASSSDRKCALLAKVDQRLQKVIARLGSPSTATSSTSSDQSGLDQAANTLGNLNG